MKKAKKKKKKFTPISDFDQQNKEHSYAKNKSRSTIDHPWCSLSLISFRNVQVAK